MKALMIGLAAISCAVTAWGEVFQMDRKGDTIVEVRKSANEYKVTCKFKPQTKFDKAINAKFNDAKGDSLCKKGLMRYLKVATNESLSVSGLYSAAPVETEGERLCYSFGVPVSGCKVMKVEAQPKPLVEPKKPAIAAATQPKPLVEPKKPAIAAATQPKPLLEPKMPTILAAAQPKPLLEPKMPAILAAAKPEPPVETNNPAIDAQPQPPVESKKPAAGDSEMPKETPKESPKPTNVVAKTSSFLSVVKYKEINGERRTISRREYQGRNFKSRKEFDRFCQEEFARIRAQGEANLRAVRNFGK